MGRPEKALSEEPHDQDRRNLALWLREQRKRSGLTLRQLAEQARYSASTLSRAAAEGRHLPTRNVVIAYARGCGADQAVAARLWRRAHHHHHTPRRTRTGTRIPVPRAQSVQTVDELRQAMLDMRRRVGMPTYMEMERRARESGAALPHTSLWKALNEGSEIHKPLFSAYLEACLVPVHQREAWELAWERANANRLNPLELSRVITSADPDTMVRIIEGLRHHRARK